MRTEPLALANTTQSRDEQTPVTPAQFLTHQIMNNIVVVV